jgi:multidrug efflux system membrane fusion protein
VTVRSLEGVTVIPAAAVMMLADGNSVYVVDANQTAARRKVETLHTFGTQVAVRGVEPGEQVVIEGKQNVRPGGKVRLDSAASPQRPNGNAPEATPGSAASAKPGNASVVAERERT